MLSVEDAFSEKAGYKIRFPTREGRRRGHRGACQDAAQRDAREERGESMLWLAPSNDEFDASFERVEQNESPLRKVHECDKRCKDD